MSIHLGLELALPPPTSLSDIELAMIDEEPERLLPQNQDSNYGLMRKLFCDQLMQAKTQIELLYNERWVDTSSVYLPWHEYQVGLPDNPNLSLALRRTLVKLRYMRGPWTTTFRQAIVEYFINLALTPGLPATFGTQGLNLANGVPLYSGIGGLAPASTYYTIADNIPGFAYSVYVDQSIGVDINRLSRELTRVTPAGINATVAYRTFNVVYATASVSGSIIRKTSGISGAVSATAFVGASIRRISRVTPGGISASATVAGTVTKHGQVSSHVNANAVVTGWVATAHWAYSAWQGPVMSGDTYTYYGGNPDAGAVEYP